MTRIIEQNKNKEKTKKKKKLYSGKKKQREKKKKEKMLGNRDPERVNVLGGSRYSLAPGGRRLYLRAKAFD